MSLFIKNCDGLTTIVAVYVDDIIVTGNNSVEISSLKSHLDRVFGIKDLGILHYFLGIEVNYVHEGIFLTQQKFTTDLLKDCSIYVSKSAATPLPLNLKLNMINGPFLDDPEMYRSMVGKLNYLTNTRPELFYVVQTLGQFMQSPRVPHLQALNHTVRYVNHIVSQGILFKASNSLKVQAFSGSDWASFPDTRRSITDYIVLFENSPVSWKSKKQSTIFRSLSEAEYCAMTATASEITWLVRLLQEFGVIDLTLITLHCYNQYALHVARNPFHERTKHIELD